MTGQVFVRFNLGENIEANTDDDDEIMHDDGILKGEFKLPDVSKNEYVRVIGFITTDSSGKRFVEAFNISKIKSTRIKS